MAEDWFRGPTWGGAAQSDFEARLARARPHNRQQYLRIKGLGIWQAGHIEAAEALLERSASAPDGYFFQTVSAWENLADIARERGDLVRAEGYYRRILSEQPSLSGTSGNVELSLAETLLDGARGDPSGEPLALLKAWIERAELRFDNEMFRWHLNLIRIAEHVGDQETAQRSAGAALTLADRGPQLPRQPSVGLVHADKATLKRLRKIAK